MKAKKASFSFRMTSFEGKMLEAMHLSANSLAETIRMADYYGQHEAKDKGLQMFGRVLDDLAVTLTSPESASMDGRYAKLTKTPEEMIEKLRVARDIELIAVDILKETNFSSRKQELELAKKAYAILDGLKLRVSLTKSTVTSRWPGAWTPAIDAEFQVVLDMEL